jgi:hypothetical protein
MRAPPARRLTPAQFHAMTREAMRRHGSEKERHWYEYSEH